jgi:trans-aconitate 2-methyltransferase
LPLARDKNQWSPLVYGTFVWERLRPAIDLLNRVDLSVPTIVFDLGCGAGRITRRLVARWPGARVTGVDASPAMLAEARQGQTTIRWVEADIASWAPELPPDLIFSNAALHWLDDHDILLPRLLGCLRPGGVLALQMPRNHGEPSHTAIVETVESGPWRERLEPLLRRRPVAAPEVYAELLLPLVTSLDIWETVYMHVLPGENPVVEWTSGTGLRPLLAALQGRERDDFLADYAARTARAYPRRDDGLTLFPFHRLFIAATR